MKRSLLTVAVTALSLEAAYAAPFMPMDARGLAMGNTGVASAKLAHAPAYNPSLLSQAHPKDDFALLIPQLGVQLNDEKNMVTEAQDINDNILPRFENIISKGNNTLENNLDDLDDKINAFTNVISSSKSTIRDVIEANNDVTNSLDSLNSNLENLDLATNDLTRSLGGISDSPLSAKVGINAAFAIPSKKFAAAVSIQTSANMSAYANFTKSDLDLLNAYVPAAQEYVDATSNVTKLTSGILEAKNPNDAISAIDDADLDAIASVANNASGFDSTTTLNGQPVIKNGQLSPEAQDPNLTSTLHLVAVATIDVGISFSREFDFSGEKIAIGITPKLQKVSTFHYADEIDGFNEINEDVLKNSQADYSRFNLDIGASYRFGETGNWIVGVVGKNLFGGNFDYQPVWVTPKDSNGTPTGEAAYRVNGGTVHLDPQFRGGIAYSSKWFNAAFDIDLVENDPIAFEAPTQFAAIGIELDVFRTMQLRAGFRTNLAADNTDIASIGFGFSPFGVHIDIAAMANIDNPETEAAIAIETGFYF